MPKLRFDRWEDGFTDPTRTIELKTNKEITAYYVEVTEMSFPITVPVVTVEIKRLVLADTAPAPATGYEVVMVKDLGYTKMWMEFKVTDI